MKAVALYLSMPILLTSLSSVAIPKSKILTLPSLSRPILSGLRSLYKILMKGGEDKLNHDVTGSVLLSSNKSLFETYFLS